MLVNFRQGIVSYPVGFLQRVGTPVGSRVAIAVDSANPLVLHFSHRDTNYVVVQKTSVGLTPPTGAFGGPFLTAVDYWLYADIDMATGAVTWSFTQVQPVDQQTTPVSPVADLHWFKSGPSTPSDDLLYKPYTMYVRNTGNTAWQEKVRVFLAKYEAGTTFVSLSINAGNANPAIKFGGTQAGLSTQNDAGFLIYDSSTSTAYKNSDGTFVTTEDVLKTGMLLGADVKIGNYVISAEAVVNINDYTVVRLSDFGKVSPVTPLNVDRTWTGIVEQGALAGQLVQITAEGIVTNAAWNWLEVNAPLYVDANGQLTATPATVNDALPVAYALTPTTVIMRPARVEVGIVDHATDVVYGAVRLDAVPTGVNGYVEFTYNSTITGTDSSGLVSTNTYTASLTVDGVSKYVSVLGSAVGTINDLITQFNAQMGGAASLSINGSALRVTSASAGDTSQVRVIDANIFEEVTAGGGYLNTEIPVDGYWDSVAASASGLAAHIADTTVHLSADQNSLLDELDAAAPGIVVKTSNGNMADRSVVSTGSTITVTDGDGVAGNIDIDLTAVTQAVSGSFVKVTIDSYGRVSGNTAVVTADITALVDATYVNVSGDTMTGDLAMGSTQSVTGLRAATVNGEAVRFDEFDAHVTDATLHLTSDQNTFLDALNLPTLVAADVNQLAGITVVPDTRQVIAGTGLSGGGTLTADVTLNLADTVVTPNPYGSATSVATFTVDQQGRLTAAADVAIAIAGTAVTIGGTTTGDILTADASGHPVDSGTLLADVALSANVVPNTRAVNTTAGDLTGGGTLATDLTLSLATTAVSANSYGSAANVPTFTVDSKGRLTAALDVAISVPLTAVNDVTATAAEVNKADTSAETETIDSGAAVSNALRITQIDNTTNGAGAITLAAPDTSMLGLVKVIEMTVANGAVTLATTNIVGSGGTTVTFSNVGDVITLVGGVAAWVYTGGNASIA